MTANPDDLENVRPDTTYVPASGDGGPGVLLLHPLVGLSPGVERFADDIAAAGFTVVAPSLYAGATATTIEDAERLMGSVPVADKERRVRAGLAALRDAPRRGGDRIGVLGMSMGAAWALQLGATEPDIAALVMVYGAGGEEDLTNARFACLGHFAGDDEWEEDEYIEATEAHIRSAGLEVTFHEYPGMKHWFAEPDRPEYDPDSARLAHDRTVAFLRDHLNATPSQS